MPTLTRERLLRRVDQKLLNLHRLTPMGHLSRSIIDNIFYSIPAEPAGYDPADPLSTRVGSAAVNIARDDIFSSTGVPSISEGESGYADMLTYRAAMNAAPSTWDDSVEGSAARRLVLVPFLDLPAGSSSVEPYVLIADGRKRLAALKGADAGTSVDFDQYVIKLEDLLLHRLYDFDAY